MGIGRWSEKNDWPQRVNWLKTERKLKIFGFTICQTYQETLKCTWDNVITGFEKVLFSWSTRTLETLNQRVEVAKMFAMSKLYYVSQVLPLSTKMRKRIEKSLSRFIFKGRHERLALSEIENTRGNGGLDLPNIGVKADSLLIKQTARILSRPNETSYKHVGYWVGLWLSEEGFPRLAEVGPISHRLDKKFPLHTWMLENMKEAIVRQEVKATNLFNVTTKSIYMSRMNDLCDSPKIEAKFPHVDFPDLVYPRLFNPILNTIQKDLLYTIVHGLYKNRERLHNQKRADDPLCQVTQCKEVGMIQDLEHIFCSCYLVVDAWEWLKVKIMTILSLGPTFNISNKELILAMFPKCTQESECMFLIGTFVQLVDVEVVSMHKKIEVEILKGVLEMKIESN